MQQWLPLFPERASSHAGRVDALYFFLVAVSGFFALLITVLIIYYAIKYRRRSSDELGTPILGSMRLEVIWVVIPLILSMVIFLWGANVFFELSSIPAEHLDIYVVAKQWMWKFQHQDGQREINELHVPVNRNVQLTMATEDVIHSFYVPAFRIKADVVPGRYNTTWFKATKPGRYHLFCAEYCGTNHSGMGGWVVVMEPSEYQAWLSGGPAEGSLASRGQKLFQDLACNTCHRSDRQGRGPMLEGLFGKPVLLSNGETVIADESYIRESILYPKAKIVAGFRPLMPTFKGLITEEQLLELVAYIKSLGAQPAPPSGTPPDTERSNPIGSTPPRSPRMPPQQGSRKTP